MQENSPELMELKKTKLFLVGISDPQLSSVFETNFDEQLLNSCAACF
jgi:hypothetical protein